MEFECKPRKAEINVKSMVFHLPKQAQSLVMSLQLLFLILITLMKKQPKRKDELRSEYDLESLLKGGVRGKYAARYRAGTNLVLLEPEVAEAFPNDKAVNDALKLVMKLKQVQDEAGQYTAK